LRRGNGGRSHDFESNTITSRAIEAIRPVGPGTDDILSSDILEDAVDEAVRIIRGDSGTGLIRSNVNSRISTDSARAT
jgi:hypothetical protein